MAPACNHRLKLGKNSTPVLVSGLKVRGGHGECDPVATGGRTEQYRQKGVDAPRQDCARVVSTEFYNDERQHIIADFSHRDERTAENLLEHENEGRGKLKS
ncbi:hypothetical protein DFH09DRAFT_1105445 [Mycena vulgaris]|nr:hypothetical protein DFH09DRAFT_1105445 [Mycena vulgaris]